MAHEGFDVDIRGSIIDKNKNKQQKKTSLSPALSMVLEGLEFPNNKENITLFARKNKEKIADGEAIIDTISKITNREYKDIKDLEYEIGGMTSI